MNNKELGYFITSVAAGIDSFERKRSRGKGVLEDEGLIPLYLGQGLIEERRYGAWEEVEADLAAIGEAIQSLSPEPGLDLGPRKTILSSLLRSLRSAVSLFRGGDLGYERKLEELVGIPAEPISRDFLAGLKAELEERLARRGYSKGSFREKIQSWEAAGHIDPDALESVFLELMAQAKARTDARIASTGDYEMELAPVKGVHYTARCSFSKKRMELNVENRFTRSAMKHLVTHEIFPGHATQNIFTLESYRNGTSTADVLLCSLNGIPGVLQEGIGDQGLEMIDWIEDEDDAITATLTRYRSAVATQGSWKINVEGVQDDIAADYMRQEGALQEARVKGRLMMARHPYRAPFIASYFYGNEAVRRIRLAAGNDAARKAAFIRELYGSLHSPQSLCQAMGVPYRSYGDL